MVAVAAAVASTLVPVPPPAVAVVPLAPEQACGTQALPYLLRVPGETKVRRTTTSVQQNSNLEPGTQGVEHRAMTHCLASGQPP